MISPHSKSQAVEYSTVAVPLTLVIGQSFLKSECIQDKTIQPLP